jgi:hypothetical protein
MSPAVMPGLVGIWALKEEPVEVSAAPTYAISKLVVVSDLNEYDAAASMLAPEMPLIENMSVPTGSPDIL